ncbi:hypothetical protein fugu_001117 [Takifugu bimaculatus]|nr:hypothetical protein fugu_001117 [Takifugu bimaculatus]
MFSITWISTLLNTAQSLDVPKPLNPPLVDVGVERFTFGFTVRDSHDFFINVTAWGNEAYIIGLSSNFSVGHCVIIENPLVSHKDPEKGEKFCPMTPSIYRLMISEAHSQVYMCADTTTIDRLVPLIYHPVKDSRDFYSLGDILANGQSLDGTIINILAAVKSIGELKYFTTSDRRNGHRLEAKLFDDSVSTFPLVCWDKEAILLIQKVIPRETVLFIADAKIGFDSFRNGMTATVNSKTIITVNPDTREAGLLFSYAKEVSESGCLDQDESLEDETGEEFSASSPVLGALLNVFLFLCAVDSITNVYTMRQLKKKAQGKSRDFLWHHLQFCLQAGPGLLSVQSHQVTMDLLSCSNELCPGKGQVFSAVTGFDLLVDLTDHTGTLQSCSLRSPAAETFLGCTTEEFTRLTDDQRTTMKWKFLLERCKVYVKIIPSTKVKAGIRGTVLACSLADPGECHTCLAQGSDSHQPNMNVNQGTVGSDPVILATAGYDHTVRFWQAHSGICTRTVQHQDSQVNSLEVTPDRSMIAAAGYQHIRMYDLNSNNPNPVINYDGVSKNITSVGFHEDGRWMYTGGEDCLARIWDLRSRNLQCQKLFQVNAPINCVCLHPNQAELIVGDQSGVIHIWDLKTDHNEQLIPEPEVSVNAVHIDPDASYMAAVNSSGNCYVWNMAGGIGEEVTQLIPKTKIPAHNRYSLRCKFSPDSTLLATCSADQTCKIWRTSNFSLMTELSIKSNNPGETSRGWMWDCAFSGDSQYIVTASSDNLARLWCVETGEIKREYSGHQKAVVCLAFNDSVLG